MNSSTAYSSVSARRTLSRPHTQFPTPSPSTASTSPAPQHSAASQPKVKWPDAVRQYVQRAFAESEKIDGIDSADMQVKLKRIISEITEAGKLHSHDWEHQPLPQQIIQEERLKATAAGKRKSMELPTPDPEEGTVPPWRKTNHSNNRNAFEDRITYPTPAEASRLEKRARKNQDQSASNGPSKYQEGILKRKQRFENGNNNHSPNPWSSPRSDSPSPAEGPVVGTSQRLEKRYFRLTSAPKPESVRPQPVLEQTLELLKRKWKVEQNYTYICDQFKSLRQDLTVQHIKNDFTVKVYEIHARIALEQGDLGEYNQCQTQLRALYLQKLGGNPAEFLAYRILYFIYTCNRSGMNDVLADLTPADKAEPAVKHALDVRSSLALGNYHRFFRLYLDPPNMGAYLMDRFIVRERLAALANMCKAYKPDVPVAFITEEIGFESYQQCVEFLCEHGAEDSLSQNKAGTIVLSTSTAARHLETHKQTAFQTVDIKGQI